MMHNQPYAAKRGYLVNCVKLLLKFTDSMTQSAESMNEKMKLVDVQRLQEKTDLYQNFDQINQLPDARVTRSPRARTHTHRKKTQLSAPLLPPESSIGSSIRPLAPLQCRFLHYPIVGRVGRDLRL